MSSWPETEGSTLSSPSRRVFFATSLAIPVIALLLWLSGLRYGTYVAAALIAMPLVLLVVARPIVGYLALVFVLYSNLDSFLPYPVFSFFLLITLFGLFLLKMMTGDRRPLPAWLTWSILLFVLICMQSFVQVRSMEPAVDIFMKYLKCFAVIYIAYQVVRSRTAFDATLWTIVLASMAMIFAGLLLVRSEVLEGDLMMTYMADSNTIRFAGLMGDANLYAMILGAVVPLCVLLLYRTRRLSLRLLLVSAGASAAVASALSFSRGGFLAVAVALILVGWRERSRRWLPFAAVLVVAAVLIFFPQNYWQRVSSLGEIAKLGRSADHSVMLRIESFHVALKLAGEHPILGVGLGQFLDHVTRADFFRYPVQVHNFLAEVIVYLGLPGLLVLLFILIRTAWISFDTIRKRSRIFTPEWRTTGYYLSISLLVIVVAKLFLPIAHDHVFWHGIVLVVLASELSGRKGDRSPSLPLRSSDHLE